MAKRGRPINWEKAYKTYKKTVNYYTNMLGTKKNDWYIDDIDAFKEKVTSQRDTKRNWSIRKATSYWAQRASLNGATMNQIDALRRASQWLGHDLKFKELVEVYEHSTGADVEYIAELVEANGWDYGDNQGLTLQALGDAVNRGELTISEMYRYMAYIGISDTELRRDLISQNVFGSD